MDLQLQGKRAFVSGASGGIGRSIAQVLSEEGCSVVAHGRDKTRTEATAHLIEKAGGKVVVAIGDLATDEGCRSVADLSLDSLGGIEIVVNNAGVAIRKDAPAWSEIPPQTWIDSYQVNFLSSLRMSQMFLPSIKEAGWGRFINISSVSATKVPALHEYGVAKAALNKLTADMSKDVGKYNATANGIMPGIIMTPAIEEYLRVTAQRMQWTGDQAEIERRYFTEMAPQSVTRMGQPIDIAGMVVFLASPWASYVTGVTFRIDGGSNPNSQG